MPGPAAGDRRGRRGAAGLRETIYEVASAAGVSVATVSRALRGLPGVSEATRQRVEKVAREMGYVPSGAASGLASRRAGVIGVVFPDLDDPTVESGHETLLYSDQVLRGAERAARRAGMAVLVAAMHLSDGPDLLRAVSGRVDGLMVLAQSVPDGELRALARRLPVVVLAGRRRVAGADFVHADNEGGAHALTTHLVRDHGYTDVVFVAGPRRSPDSGWRFAGFQRAMADAGLPVPRDPAMRGDFTEASGWALARQLLERREHLPRAIVAGNDQMAAPIVVALGAAGHAVPEEIAVTGFDDAQLARLIEPSLTTVHQPMRELGERCVELLLRRVENPGAPPATALLPTTLLTRQSCGCSWRAPSWSSGPEPRQAANEVLRCRSDGHGRPVRSGTPRRSVVGGGSMSDGVRGGPPDTTPRRRRAGGALEGSLS
ncbi:MAG: LacI family DNA-binding transcriptional regulator [Acidimicrobiales bacterium]